MVRNIIDFNDQESIDKVYTLQDHALSSYIYTAYIVGTLHLYNGRSITKERARFS